MALVLNWFVPPLVLAVLVSSTLAVLVYKAAPYRHQNRLLALALLFDAQLLAWPAVAVSFDDAAHVWAARVTAMAGAALWAAAYLSLLGTLETPWARPLRTRTGLAIVWALGLAGILFVLVNPTYFYPGAIERRAWGFDAVLGPGALLVGYTTMVAVSLIGILLAWSAWRRAAPASANRRQAGAFLAAFATRDVLLIAGTVLGWWIAGPEAELAGVLLHTSMGILFPVILAYGILRTQLFDIDLKVKFAVEKSTIVAAFAVAFLVVSEVVERVLDVQGELFGLAAAVGVGLAFRRVERAATRLTGRLMPGVKDTAEYRASRKRAVYRAALEEAAADGALTPKDRRVLGVLAAQLGLNAQAASAIEREVGTGRA